MLEVGRGWLITLLVRQGLSWWCLIEMARWWWLLLLLLLLMLLLLLSFAGVWMEGGM